MRRHVLSAIVSPLAFLFLVVLIASPARAQVDTFEQWIAPLECTRSETVDGSTETVILTPEECDDFLNSPPPGSNNGGSGTDGPGGPNAPDTGFFRDPAVETGLIILLGCAAVILVVALRSLSPNGNTQKTSQRAKTWLRAIFGRHRSP